MKICINNAVCRVAEGTKEEIEALDETLSFNFPDAYWTSAYRQGYWDGNKRFYLRGSKTFPAGMLPYAVEVLGEAAIRPTLIDDRGIVPVPRHITPPHKWAGRLQSCGLPAHPLLTVLQYKGVKAILHNRLCSLPWPRGLVSYPTGSGKTNLTFWIMESLGLPSLYMIDRQDLLLQSMEVYERLTGEKPGQLGIGVDEVKIVTFGMLQSLYLRVRDNHRNTLEYLKNVKVVVVDEAHMVSDNTYLDVLGAMPNASVRVATSGSLLRRKDLGDWYLMGQFGDVVIHIPSKTLRDAGLLSKVKVFLYSVKVPQKTGKNYPQHEKEVIIENEYRNTLAVLTALRAASAGWKTLLLVKRRAHGDLIRALFKAYGADVPFLCYKDPADLRKAYLDEMRHQDRRIIISSGIFKVGIDVPAIRCLVRLDGGASTIDSLQVAGRGMRRKSELNELYLFDFMDNTSHYFVSHSRARCKVYKAEGYEIHTILDVEDVEFPEIQSQEGGDRKAAVS